MPSLAEIQQPVADNVRQYEAFVSALLRSDNPFVNSICDYILARRGKQMRPLLALLSAALHGSIGERSYAGAAIAEMIHTASLVHDDVVDESLVRRGAPSVNAMWNSRTAVLVGDFIFARTYHTCLDKGGPALLTEVTRAIHELCEGELIQTEQSQLLAMTRDIYFDIIYKKTGSLIGASGAIGALSVEAPEEAVARMRAFGDNLGIAFQIKDDLLDFSPESVTGKPSGGDLRERKITLPLLYLLERSTESERTRLLGLLREAADNPASASALQKAVLSGGGVEHAESCMLAYRDRALTYLAPYPDTPVRRSLEQFADFALSREK